MPTVYFKSPNGAGDEKKAEGNAATESQIQIQIEAENLGHVVDILTQNLNSTKEELAIALDESRASSKKCSKLERELKASEEKFAKKLKDLGDNHNATMVWRSQDLKAGKEESRRVSDHYRRILTQFDAELHRRENFKRENEELKTDSEALQLKVKGGQAEVEKAATVNEEVVQLREENGYLRGTVQAMHSLKIENKKLNKQLNEDSRVKKLEKEVRDAHATIYELQATETEATAPIDNSLTERYARTLQAISSKLVAMSRRISAMTDTDKKGAGWGLVVQTENVVKADTRSMVKDINQCLALGGKAGGVQPQVLDDKEFPALGASLKTTTAGIAGSSDRALWGGSTRSSAAAGQDGGDNEHQWTTVNTHTSPGRLMRNQTNTTASANPNANTNASTSTTSNNKRNGKKPKK